MASKDLHLDIMAFECGFNELQRLGANVRQIICKHPCLFEMVYRYIVKMHILKIFVYVALANMTVVSVLY